MNITHIVALLLSSISIASAASATTFTETSPTGGKLPTGVTKVGGIVLDLKGSNGNRIISQLAASSLYRGYADLPENGPPAGSAPGNPLTIGTQTGFSTALLANLGGGLSSASVRFTLYDGDTAPGTFDEGDNTLLLNGIDFGNWSTPATQETDGTGTNVLGSGTGFGSDILSTGFFTSTDAASLASLYGSLSGGSVAFQLADVDPYDNFYNFTLGVDGGLIDIGTGPVVNPPMGGAVPEASSWAMMIVGFGMTGATMRRRRRHGPARPIA